MVKATTSKVYQSPKARASFKKSLIAMAVVGLSGQSFAQDSAKESEAADAETEVIQVTGARRNAMSAQDIKLEADTVVDALSAEDMGSLPDRSVLEAISRLPGVALERFAGANDPDHFGVEGGGVVVRGLGQVRSEFNGRDSFSAEPSGNGLSFEDVSPELLGSVTIFKNQTADMIEGGIAGTVSLNTRKPFDSEGRKFAFSADATYTDLREETSPTLSGLYSDVWELDSGGRLGFLVSYSNSEIKVTSDGTQTGIYKVDGLDSSKFTANGGRITSKDDDRERRGLASSLQFESADKTLLVTAEYIRSQAIAKWNEYVSETDNGNNPSAYNSTFETIGNGDSYFDDGVLNTAGGNGLTQIFQTRVREEDSIVSDYSLNVKFTPNDTWAFQYDLQYIDSTKEVIDHSIMGALNAAVSLTQNGSDLPEIAFFQGDYTGGAVPGGTPFQTGGNYFYRSAMDHAQDNEGDELATRFDAEYTFDEGIIESVSAGVRYAKRELISRESTFNWQNLSESWGANGRRYHYDETSFPVDEVTFDDFARGGVFSAQGGNTFLFPSQDLVRALDTRSGEIISGFTNPDGNRAPNWKPLADRDGVIEGTKYLPSELNETEETNTAAYVKVNFAGDFGDMYYSANAGLRYVKIENDTIGFNTFQAINRFPGAFPADQQAFLSGTGAQENTASSEYTNVLPSVNVKLNITDELILRLAFSEAISKPALDDMRNFINIRGRQEELVAVYPDGVDPNNPGDVAPISARYSSIFGQGGNPDLKPMEAKSYDIALEYYFDEASSLTATVFHKDIKNYFINGAVTRAYTNNGVTQDVNFSTTTNGDSGRVSGYEIAYTQFFDDLPGMWSGLGTQLNYTRIIENGSPNADNILDADGNIVGSENDNFFTGLPLEGLSGHNANAALMYEKDEIKARIAYNWRSRYLLTSEDVITKLPIFNEANGSLDASFFYDVTENIQVGVQGTNLNNNVTQTLMQVNQEGDVRSRSHFVSDRRYSLVVKGNF